MRCPVVLKWSKKNKRYDTCRKEVQNEKVTMHMFRDHGIDSNDVIQFYLTVGKDPEWIRRA